MTSMSQEKEVEIKNLEQAAQIIMAPPNIVTAEQRQSAEQIFQQFRATKLPYEVCRHILESSSCKFVQFQAACTIREAVLREWNLLDKGTPTSLLAYLFHYTTTNPRLENFVREQLLYAIAVIVKRSRLTISDEERQGFYQQLSQLATSSDLSQQLMASGLMSAIINEYCSSDRSSEMGLPWEFHNKCKHAFQEHELKTVFQLVIHILSESDMAAKTAQEVTVVYQRYLQLAEQILNWEFIPTFVPRRRVGTFGRAQFVTLKPTESWRDILLTPQVLDIFFKLHPIIRQNPDLAHHCTQCISQLASINGQVFADDAAAATYLEQYLTRFLHLMARIEIFDYEAYAIANAVNSLTILFPMKSFLQLPPAVFTSFTEWMASVTCAFCRSAANEETLLEEDRIYTEAYGKMLDSWTTLYADDDICNSHSLRPESITMIDSYLKCHIGPPEGVRNQRSDGGERVDEGEYGDEEEDDREQFKDHLLAIGIFCRHVPDYSIPALARLLEDRCKLYCGALGEVQTRGSASGLCLDKLHSVHEDLHWLVLLAGHALTEECESEIATIPTEILDYCTQQAGSINLEQTMQWMAHVRQDPATTPDINPDNTTIDQTVRLTTAVFATCEIWCRALTANLSSVLSPQVASTVLWFLARWARAYLLPPENHYSNLSETIRAMYGKDTAGSDWCIEFLLHSVQRVLTLWPCETALCLDAANLLVRLMENRWKADVVVKSARLMELVELAYQADQGEKLGLQDLAAPVRRQITRALVLAACAVHDTDERKQTLHQKVLNSHHARFTSVAVRPDLAQVFQNNDVKAQVVSVLEASCGMAEATTVSNYNTVFAVMLPILRDSVGVLNIYHQHASIVQLVLDLFVEVANRQLCYLSSESCAEFYTVVTRLIDMYAKHHRGGNRWLDLADDGDELVDVALIIELLTHVMSREFLNLAADVNENGECDSGGVTLYGLAQIMPLLTTGMLHFPDVSTHYYKLLSFIADIAPQKLAQLQEQHFHFLMLSIQAGLSQHGADISKLCLDFLLGLASHAVSNADDRAKLQDTLAFFLQAVLEFILTETFDMDLVDCVGGAFYALICCNVERYMEIVREIIQRQPVPELHQRLMAAFTNLTPPTLSLDCSRSNRIRFLQLFDQFFIDVRGVLCIK